MWSRAAGQEAAQESAMIQTGAAHSNCDLWRFTNRRTRWGITRDGEPVIEREWLIRLRHIDSGVGSRCKHLRR